MLLPLGGEAVAFPFMAAPSLRRRADEEVDDAESTACITGDGCADEGSLRRNTLTLRGLELKANEGDWRGERSEACSARPPPEVDEVDAHPLPGEAKGTVSERTELKAPPPALALALLADRRPEDPEEFECADEMDSGAGTPPRALPGAASLR